MPWYIRKKTTENSQIGNLNLKKMKNLILFMITLQIKKEVKYINKIT